jgi:hypothetical protein
MIGLLKRVIDDEITAADLSDALRQHAEDASSDDIERVANVVEQFIRGVPDALAWALALSKDPRCGRSVAFATGTVLNYVFDEDDLLPESSFGNLGLLDDAYLVHAFVAGLKRAYPFAELDVVYSAPDAEALEIVASLLPEGVAHSLLRTCESTIQVAQALFVPAQTNGAGGPVVEPELRVGAAVRATTSG